MAGVCALLPARGGFVGRAFTPAAWGLAAVQGLRDDAGIVPYGCGARSCRALQDISAAKRQCTPPSAPCGAATSPCRGGFIEILPPKRLPCKGLRSRAPPAADTARRSRCSGRRTQVCFSTRSAMRAPQTGNVGVSRLRGAAPCPANTLPGRRRLPRSCGITELCGAALAQNRSITPPQASPAGEIARPTMQGKRAAQPWTAGMAGG